MPSSHKRQTTSSHRGRNQGHSGVLWPSTMDITDFVFSQREEVLLAGDYNGYHARSSRKLHKLRKKLGQTTPKGRKYTAKTPVTAENVASNVSYAFPRLWLMLLVLTVLQDTCSSCSLALRGHGLKQCTVNPRTRPIRLQRGLLGLRGGISSHG